MVTEGDPQVLLLDANASFRTAQHDEDRSAVLRKLDAAVKSYAEVLKANGNLPDAAYNYEYVVRVRDGLQRSQSPTSSAPREATLHGQSGAPPANADMSKFKILIPRRSDERKEDLRAGKGNVKVRKG